MNLSPTLQEPPISNFSGLNRSTTGVAAKSESGTPLTNGNGFPYAEGWRLRYPARPRQGVLLKLYDVGLAKSEGTCWIANEITHGQDGDVRFKTVGDFKESEV